MPLKRLVVGFASSREQADTAAEALRLMGLAARVTERTGEAGAPFAVAYYARNGREAARMEQVFETLQIEGEVMYEPLPDDHRLIRIYGTHHRPGTADLLANLLERAGLHVVRGPNELFVPRSQEADALNVIRQFEQSLPEKRRSLFDLLGEDSTIEDSEPGQDAESAAALEETAFTDWENIALVPNQVPQSDAATAGPAVGHLPEAWPCCPSCSRPRERAARCAAKPATTFRLPNWYPRSLPTVAPCRPNWPRLPGRCCAPCATGCSSRSSIAAAHGAGTTSAKDARLPSSPAKVVEPLNPRIVLGLVLTVAVVVGILVYLVVVSRPHGPQDTAGSCRTHGSAHRHGAPCGTSTFS
jgi:hypothetical protein